MVDAAGAWTSTRDGLAVCDAAGLVRRLRDRDGLRRPSATPSPSTSRAGCAPTCAGAGHRPGAAGRGSSTAATALHAERHPEAPGRADRRGARRRCRRWRRWSAGPGSRPERWYREMQRPLTDLPAAAAGPRRRRWCRSPGTATTRCGGRTTPPSPEHHGSSERDPEAWQSLFTGQRGFRPDLSRLAIEDGAVVGYVLAYVFEADTAARGHPRGRPSGRSASCRRRAAAAWPARSSPRCCAAAARSRTARARASASTPRT